MHKLRQGHTKNGPSPLLTTASLSKTPSLFSPPPPCEGGGLQLTGLFIRPGRGFKQEGGVVVVVGGKIERIELGVGW